MKGHYGERIRLLLSILTSASINTLQDLSFGACKLCLQAPVSSGITDPAQLSGKRIVTSFPNLARKYFDKHDTPDRITSKFMNRHFFYPPPSGFSTQCLPNTEHSWNLYFSCISTNIHTLIVPDPEDELL